MNLKARMSIIAFLSTLTLTFGIFFPKVFSFAQFVFVGIILWISLMTYLDDCLKVKRF